MPGTWLISPSLSGWLPAWVQDFGCGRQSFRQNFQPDKPAGKKLPQQERPTRFRGAQQYIYIYICIYIYIFIVYTLLFLVPLAATCCLQTIDLLYVNAFRTVNTIWGNIYIYIYYVSYDGSTFKVIDLLVSIHIIYIYIYKRIDRDIK